MGPFLHSFIYLISIVISFGLLGGSFEYMMNNTKNMWVGVTCWMLILVCVVCWIAYLLVPGGV